MSATSSQKDTSKKTGYHHGDLRRALLDAAAEILESDGPAALSLRAVARRAGVSATAPYHHFADKQALLAAVNAQSFEGLSDNMSQTGAAAGDSIDRIVLLGIGYVNYATRNPERFRLMFGASQAETGTDDNLAKKGRAAFTMIGGAISHHLARMPPPAPEPATATLAAWSIVHGLATLLVDGRLGLELTDREGIMHLVRDTCRIFTAGLGGEGRPLR